jgi:Barstar (barnase inhibitor)
VAVTALVDHVYASWETAVQQGGVVRLGVRDLTSADVEATADELDRSFVWLDTVDAVTAADLIRAWGEALDFPEEAGVDWDSVDECLADLDVTPASGLVIVWSGWESIEEEDDHVMATAVDALCTAAQSWTDDGRPWAVLIVGHGPSWDLPWVGVDVAPWDREIADPVEDDDDGDELPRGLESPL